MIICHFLFYSAFTKPLISILKIPTGGKGESINMRPLEEEEDNEKKEREEAVKKEMSGWEKFDNKYLQPYFGKVRRHQAKPEHVSHHGDTMLNIGDTPGIFSPFLHSYLFISLHIFLYLSFHFNVYYFFHFFSFQFNFFSPLAFHS